MSEWRYIATRLDGDGNETVLDWDIPLKDPQIEDTLSNVSGLSGTIAPEVARLIGPDGTPLLEEWATCLYAEIDGEIRGGGILTHSGFDGPKWSLEAGGFIGYWSEMPYVGGGAYYVETDTLDIVRHIINHVQSQNGSDIGLEVDQTKSGVLVGSELESEEYDPEGGSGGLTLQTQAYKLAWYQDHDLLSNINGLAEDSPFDYRERHYWDGDVIRHRLEFGVPKIGERKDRLRFTIGENIFAIPSIERNGEDYASEVYALGAGEGSKMIRGHATLPRRRLRRVAVVSDSSMRRVNRANSMAQSEIRWRQELDDISNVVVRDHPSAPLGSFGIGDEIYIAGQTGWVEVGGWFRVVSLTIKPEDPGTMDLSVARSDRLAV